MELLLPPICGCALVFVVTPVVYEQYGVLAALRAVSVCYSGGWITTFFALDVVNAFFDLLTWPFRPADEPELPTGPPPAARRR